MKKEEGLGRGERAILNIYIKYLYNANNYIQAIQKQSESKK